MASSTGKEAKLFNPAPLIPMRNEYDEIDVSTLNGADLESIVKGDHIAPYDIIYPIWRGVAEDGEPFDKVDSQVEVPGDYDADVGLVVTVANRFVEPYEGGWAFLSYKLNGSDEATPDSRRVFSYLGLRDRSSNAETLAVAQVRESHDLTINFDDLPSDGARFLVPRYQAIQVGDKATLTMRRFTATGEDKGDVTAEYVVTAENLQQIPYWQLSKGSFVSIRDGGRAEVHYEVALAGSSDLLVSPVQKFTVTGVASVIDLLPKASIDGYAGEPLDPGFFPDGLTVRLPMYADVQPGDHVLLHWKGPAQPEPVVLTARMDASSLEGKEVVFHVPPDLLVLGEHTVFYQFARSGQALSAEALSVELKVPRELSAPDIERAAADGVGRQQLQAGDAILGAYVVVPDVALPGETIEVHWEGYPNNGQQITDMPEEAGGRRFKIAPAVVAANMHQPLDPDGRRFRVYYYVINADGVRSKPSTAVDLRVVPLALGNTIFCREANNDGELYASSLTANGALLRVTGTGLWPFAAKDQLFTMAVQGVAVLRDAKPITAAEMSSATVDQWLSRTVYGDMEDNKQHTLSGDVSFDKGDSWHSLEPARLTPKKSL
ncbi:hypothetical protein ACIP1G_26675 [Pseudomonas sp. NPDC089392]|uniref:hypothetical protein n=1 Tax=Pseudomonas sp. NPDC089392 TaxID=3364459 RepID=UPI00380B0693